MKPNANMAGDRHISSCIEIFMIHALLLYNKSQSLRFFQPTLLNQINIKIKRLKIDLVMVHFHTTISVFFLLTKEFEEF